MAGFVALLRQNRNYRSAWVGQVVSEIGDHFNNIAVFSLALETTHSGLVVSGVMLSRAVPAVLAGPLAGVTLDRLDRRTVMIASDLVRAVVALAFVLTVHQPKPWLLYSLSGLLMFASPFFSSGRAAILPRIASKDELHTAELADADDPVDDDHDWHAARRVQRGALRLYRGVRDQQPLVRVFGVGDQPPAAARRRPAAGRRDDRSGRDAPVPRICRGAALPARPAA